MKPKRERKIIALFSMLMFFYAAGNAQDYYGGNSGNSWRKPVNNYQSQGNENNGNSEPSGYISINFGFAIPEGGFASSFGGGYGGYALSGDVFHFSIGVPINHSNFGVAFMFGGYDNQYNINTYASNNAVYALSPQSGQTDYSETSIMGGLYATYPIGRLSIDGRLMIGGLLCSLPEQDYGYEDAQGNQWELDLQPSSPTSFAVDAGIGARFLITTFGRRKLCAMVNLDYLYSSVSYSTSQDVYETPTTGTNAGVTVQYVPSPLASGHLPIELLNVSLGLGYQL